MMKTGSISIEIEPGRTVKLPELDEAIRATAGKILAEKMSIGVMAPTQFSEAAAYRQVEHNRAILLLQIASQERSVPLDELIQQTHQWSQSRPESLIECINIVYQKAMWQQPFPWEKNDE